MSNAVPNGWNITTLGEFATVKGGKRLPKGETFSESKTPYPYIRVTDFNAGTIEVNNLRYVTNDIREKIKRYTISSTDLYISIAGTLGLIGEIPCSLNGALLTENAAKIIFNDIDKSDKVFFKYYLSSGDAQDHFHQSKGTGGGVPKLALFRIEDTPVLSPPLPEQQKIAAILSSVDEVIEKTQAQIVKLKDLKTGLMQELLSPREPEAGDQTGAQASKTNGLHHTEFKNSPLGRIPVGWEVITVKDIFNIMESGWSPQCEPVRAGTDEWAVLKTTAVKWEGFNYKANKKLPDNLEPRPAIQVNNGDILITRAGPTERVGVVAYVDYVPDKIMLSDKLIRLTINEGNEPLFISYWLSSEIVKKFFSIRTTGLAQSQTNISQEILKSVPCLIPSLKEQIVISRSILCIEKRLKITTKRLLQYQVMKKALMQDLLTGKVRVKIDAA